MPRAPKQPNTVEVAPMKIVEIMDMLKDAEFQRLSPAARKWLNEATRVYNLRKTPMPTLSESIKQELIKTQREVQLWNRSRYEPDAEKLEANREGLFFKRRRDRGLEHSANIGRSRVKSVIR